MLSPAQITDLDWSKVAQLTELVPACPCTWDGFGSAWEIHRQIFVQHLSMPEGPDEWNSSIWIDLNQALIAFGRRLLTNLDQPHQRDNLQACISHAEDELRVLLQPLDPSKCEEIRKALGIPEAEPEEGEEWKAT